MSLEAVRLVDGLLRRARGQACGVTRGLPCQMVKITAGEGKGEGEGGSPTEMTM